ncbi:MAG: hypothetical protein ACYC46_07550 [Acidobacteriaceae bacterium]
MSDKKQSILAAGFLLTLRHWRALVWTYVFQLALAILFTLRFHAELAAILNHSLASRSLVNGFDIGALAEVLIHLHQSGGAATSFVGIALFALLYLLLTAGTLFVFQTGEKALLSTLLSTGLRYFWRFLRLLLIAIPVQTAVLGVLFGLRSAFLKHADRFVVGVPMFLHTAISLLVIGLIAVFLRVYFDLTEVYTLQLGIRGDRRMRRSLLPALRVYFANFGRVYFSFLGIQILGKLGLMFFFFVALQLLATPHVGPLFLLAQIGLFLLLAARFWQHGMETALVLANPIPEPAPLPVPEEAYAPLPDPIPSPEPEPPYFTPTNSDNEDACATDTGPKDDPPAKPV